MYWQAPRAGKGSDGLGCWRWWTSPPRNVQRRLKVTARPQGGFEVHTWQAGSKTWLLFGHLDTDSQGEACEAAGVMAAELADGRTRRAYGGQWTR